MVRLLFLIFAGIITGTFLILILLPFLIFLFFLKLFSGKSSGRVFVWRPGVFKKDPSFNTDGNFNRYERYSSENLSDSVYDVKAEVVETVVKTEIPKQIQR